MFTIDDLPFAIMERAGTYAVRLVTPLPVAGGIGTSEQALLFDVVAPLPRIAHVHPRGVVQSLDAEGAPLAQTVVVSILRVCGGGQRWTPAAECARWDVTWPSKKPKSTPVDALGRLGKRR